MAGRSDHEFIDEKHFGKTFPEVHRFLDSKYGSHGGLHRMFLHNREGVEEIRGLWGDEAAKSAELHILLDMGHIPTRRQWDFRVSSAMDGLGRTVEYLGKFKDCDDEAVSIAFHGPFSCVHCQKETDQRLIRIQDGLFSCSVCQGTNLHPDYRLDNPFRY